MDGHTRIELLGRFVVSVDGAAIPDGSWRLRKSRSILKALALAPGRALHPERVQALLWPDRDPASAANNLRQAVYHARRALTSAGADGAAVLRSQGELLTLDEQVTLDVDEFEAAATRAGGGGARGRGGAAREGGVGAGGGGFPPKAW